MLTLSDATSIVAVLLSALALVISLHEALSNKPRLRFKATHLFMTGSTGTFAGLQIINFGRQPTTIDNVQIRIPGTSRELYVAYHPLGSQVPHVLGVGCSVQFIFEFPDAPPADPFETGLTPSFRTLAMDSRTRFLVKDAWSDGPHEVRFPRMTSK